MSGINSGILQNASPLSAEAIKELERKVLETGEAYAYLDQNSKLCFATPHGVDGIKKLAWNSAYTINNPIKDGTCIRQAYKKTGLESSMADKLFTKPSVNADWTECDPAKFEADYEYTVTNGEATITSYIGDGGDIIVPNRLGGYPVVAIDEQAFTYAWQLSSVIIMEGITSIGANAFFYCDCIRSMYIPSSVTYIGNGAFEGCCAMTDITLLANITTINEFTFYLCGALTNIIIPNSVTRIDMLAFSQCFELRSVIIPYGVTSIGVEAFSGCSSLESIIIPNGVTAISDGTFSGCSSLTSIVIPDGIVTVGDNAFYYCSSLTNVIIPNGVTSIGSYAFSECHSLTSVIIPDSVTYIGNDAFCYGYSIETVTLGRGVSNIYPYTFAACESLTSIIIPDSVTSIEEYAFIDCNSLTDIYYRGTQAQWNSVSLANLWCSELPATYIQCSDGAADLDGNPISLYTVPENCTYYKFISQDENSIEYTAGSIVAYAPSLHDSFYDGELAYEYIDEEYAEVKAGWNVYAYMSDQSEYQIRTEINNAPVVSIGPGAFSGSEITQLVIPDSIVSIYDGAFADCPHLNIITFHGTVEQWHNIIARNPNWSQGSSIRLVLCSDSMLTPDGNYAGSNGGSND